MGYYINEFPKGKGLPVNGKAKILMDNGAIPVNYPITFQPNLVCVVENAMWDAAGYCYSEQEMQDFLYGDFLGTRPDGRQRTWLIVEGAPELSGYNK